MFQKINDFLSSRKNSKLINEISNKYLQKVNSFEDELRSLSQDDLINKIYDLKKFNLDDESFFIEFKAKVLNE